MADEVDRLEVVVEAQASKANKQLDSLVTKLDKVSRSLMSANASGFTRMASGVNALTSAMQSMNTVKTGEFTSLAKNINKLSDIKPAALSYASESISEISRSLSALGKVSKNSQEIGELVKNLSKLGNKSMSSAITNIPLLGKALNELMTTLSKSPAVSSNLIKMTTAMANLSSQGSKVGSASRAMSKGVKTYSDSADRASNSSKSFAYYLGKLYANYYLAIRASKGLASAVMSSMDYIEQYNYFNVTLGKISSEWSDQWQKYGYSSAEAYGNSFKDRLTDTMSKMTGFQMNDNGTLTATNSNSLGLDATALTNYSAGLLQVTNSLGLTGEASTATSKALTMLSGDMSSFRNVDLKTVMTNFQSGLIGQSRAERLVA